METCLRDLNTKIPWKILFLQEFVYTRKLDTPSFDTSDRHLVLCNISTMGNRPLALIFNHSVRHLVVEGSRQDYDRGIAVGIHWHSINFMLGAFHLVPKMIVKDYQNSIKMMQDFSEIRNSPPNSKFILKTQGWI